MQENVQKEVGSSGGALRRAGRKRRGKVSLPQTLSRAACPSPLTHSVLSIAFVVPTVRREFRSLP